MKVLRQLDIETSRTIAIEVVSGVGEVADDSTPISLWALGDQMLIRVWQQKVSLCKQARAWSKMSEVMFGGVVDSTTGSSIMI